MKKQNIKDQIHAVNSIKTAQAAFAVLEASQDFKAAEQLVAAGITFLLWCKRNELDPREMLNVSEQVFRNGLTSNNNHILALKHYMKIDVPDAYAFTF